MVTLVIFLNLFFAPSVSLWVYYKRRNSEPQVSVSLLMQYTIFAACNVPFTKIGIALARVLFGWHISIDSGYYTLLALMSAVSLPVLIDKLKAAYVHREDLYCRGKAFLTKRSIKYKAKVLMYLPIVASIVITYIIRKPLELYLGNVNEFLFTMNDFLPWLVLISVVFLVVAGMLVVLLPDALFTLVSVVSLWFAVASWLQDLFLNKKLAEVNGGPMDWGALGSLPKNNLLIWLALLVGAFWLFTVCRRMWPSVVKCTAGALCLIQLVAVASVLISAPEPPQSDLTLSGETQMQLATEDNVIVFILDTISNNTVSYVLEQYPHTKDIVKDFVYYDNVCCDYYCTFPSVTHLLTGTEFEFGNEQFEPYAEDWLKKAWSSERCQLFFQKLKDNGYTSHLNDSVSSYVFGNAENLEGKFDNVVQKIEMQADTVKILQKLLKFSAYCCAPYVAKPQLEVLTSDFADAMVPKDVQMPITDNAKYYKHLQEEPLSVNPEKKKLFVINYLNGLHAPYTLSADGSYTESATSDEVMQGLFTILEEYFSQLKNLGLYNSSTIIIMGDHGDGSPKGLSPAFFMKQSEDKRDHMAINSAPVDYNDFQATILKLIGEDDGSFGPSFFDWNEGDERRRIVYSRVDSEDGPYINGSFWNLYYGYVYYHDAEELAKHVINDGPDTVEYANKWRNGS